MPFIPDGAQTFPAMDEHDPDLEPIDETTANPILSDSELSDVDEDAYAGIDTNRIGATSADEDEDEGPSVFALRPSKVKSDERRKRKAEEDEAKRRRREARQLRHQRKEEEREQRAASTKKRRSQPAETDDSYNPDKRPEDPEEARRWDLDRLMDSATAAKSAKRRKKDDDIDLESAEEDKIRLLKEAMERAYEKDIEAVRNKKPATHKLALLPTVEAVLARTGLHEFIIDNLLLRTIRTWLEPSVPDRSLPAYAIQRTLLTALQNLPITKEHLAESGVGKVVIFYRNSPRVEESIRRIANSLWVEWSRPILRKSANFRDRQIATATYTADMQLKVPKKMDSQESRRTVVPQTIRSAFDIAPRTNLNSQNVPAQRGNRAENTDMYKRLKQKVQNKSAKVKRDGGVSIQGGGRV